MKLLRDQPVLGAMARWLVLLLCVLAWLPGAHAQFGAPTEEAVKAAYLSKLRHYVEWPARAAPAPGSRTVIGIVGADEVAEQLARLSAVRDPHGSLALRRLRPGDPLDGVQILYVGEAWFSRAGAMVDAAGARAVLVVTESERGLPPGSVINFRLADERIRFDISLVAAERAGLKVSSQLLALAATVIKEKP